MSRACRLATATVVATVLCCGAAAAAGAATSHSQGPRIASTTVKVTGVVASVNGVSSAGTCGTGGTGGEFGLASQSTSYIVDVGASTTFKEHGVASPSFSNLCVGDKAHAVGSISTSAIFAAAEVTVTPPRPQQVTGIVTSVNDVSDAGTCGTGGTGGEFGLASHGTSFAVDVGSTSTTFKEHGVASPSFSNVCVGDKAHALGPISTSDTVTAAEVTVTPPRPQQVTGIVTSVNDVSDAGTCGTGGTGGEFGLASHGTSFAVDVGSTSTTFKEHGVASPSFSNVCVGDKAHALGPISTSDTVTATEVTVTPPRPKKLKGTVASVNGVSSAGTCGTGGAAGEFDLSSHSTTYVVNVGLASTTYKEHGVASPSFSNVCVGDKVRTMGSVSSSDVVTATEVTVIPPRPKKVTGNVVSIDGVTSIGTCGKGKSAGDFELTSHDTTYLVDVGSTSTIFKESGVSSPSFASTCVSDKTRVIGTITTGGILTASEVSVIRQS